MREHDLSTTHAIMNPQVDRSRPDAEAGAGEIALHKVGETSEGIVVRGARMLATLAPYADEISIYPGSPLRLEDTAYALCFAIPMNTPGLKVVLRDSFAKPRPAFDYPLSSRFDEQDGMVIFDDVVVPWDRVFMDGDTIGYDEVISHTNWRAQIVNQAMTRAWTKLELTFGLAHAITEVTGVNTFDHVQEKLGEIWIVRRDDALRRDRVRGRLLRRRPRRARLDARRAAARRAARPHAEVDPARVRADAPGRRRAASWRRRRWPTSRARWPPRSSGTTRRAAWARRDRIRLFRLAWDLIGSDLGSRGELYERFYLQDSHRMTGPRLQAGRQGPAQALVDRFLQDEL